MVPPGIFWHFCKYLVHLVCHAWAMRSFAQMPESVRPREKLARLGAAALTTEELWCCVLGQGNRRRPLLSLARAAAQLNLSAEPDSLGFGLAQFACVSAVQELRRRDREQAQIRLGRVEDVLLLCQDLVRAPKESVRALYCSVKAEVLHVETLALGGLNAAHLEPKDIFYPLRFLPVDSIVLCHNHPSGDVTPSEADLVFTRRIELACEVMGLHLRDHVIVSKNGYCSLRVAGKLGREMSP